MALEGVPQMSQSIRDFAVVVREYLRDHPELNRLIYGEETSDRQIAWAILDALEDFNGTPPITNHSLEELMQYHQRALLLRMVTCTILESVGLLQTRNHINYSDGGLNVGVNDKTPMLMQWLNYYKSTAEQAKQRVKVALNISSIMGSGVTGLASELWAVNNSYVGF